MTNWQLLFETNLTTGQDWVISSTTTALEFRIEQTLVPSLGLFAIAQILDPATEEYIDIKNVPAKAGNTRLVLNPLQYTTRQIGVKYRYAEWPGEPEAWHIAVYYNADVTESANPVSIVVDVLPRIVGAEPLGAANQAKLDAIAAAQAMIAALPLEGGNFDPLGSAATAQANAIAHADALVDSLTAADVDAIPTSEKGQASGVATLGTDGKVPALQLPTSNNSGLTQQQVTDLIDTFLDPHQFKWSQQMRVVSGNQLQTGNYANSDYQTTWYQSPAANGDELELGFSLPAGTYTLTIRGLKRSDASIQQVTFKNPDNNQASTLGTMDWYASALTYNQEFQFSFSSTKPGIKLFGFKVTGRNAASTSWRAELTSVKVVKVS